MHRFSRQEFDTTFIEHAAPVLAHERVKLMANYVQHGDTSTLLHVLAVSYYASWWAHRAGLKVSHKDLIQGALLHDYYLYDWHVSDSSHGKWHGFTHPKAALANAKQDFDISRIQHDMIVHHMFPLTPAPPRSREAILLCIVDKLCSLWETFGSQRYSHLRQMGWIDATSR